MKNCTRLELSRVILVLCATTSIVFSILWCSNGFNTILRKNNNFHHRPIKWTLQIRWLTWHFRLESSVGNFFLSQELKLSFWIRNSINNNFYRYWLLLPAQTYQNKAKNVTVKPLKLIFVSFQKRNLLITES